MARVIRRLALRKALATTVWRQDHCEAAACHPGASPALDRPLVCTLDGQWLVAVCDRAIEPRDERDESWGKG